MRKAVQLCANLLTLMSERLAHYETASQLTLAMLLDPRFKTIGFCNPSNTQNAIKRLTAECATKVRETASDPIPEHGETSTAAACTSGTGLWDLLDQRVMETRKVKSATANATIEVQHYLSESNIPRSENPLQYWHKHKHIYPHLYMLALGFLCFPASSVPCEWVFSKAGEVVSKKRNRLRPSTVEKILFLNKNLTTSYP
ncbi:zinc finger BED domain-containing protein 4-like [Tachysurus fulvidraco]|uniref:zinc finger BED domain-containing protein 4-like n=1 Tax=Tachysurus fulvidraco TaxID=1234273 RepID=UPI001FEDA009|nr:zinc finger BED domain-containing protein 4-like [Tachysurus fulvidraco]